MAKRTPKSAQIVRETYDTVDGNTEPEDRSVETADAEGFEDLLAGHTPGEPFNIIAVRGGFKTDLPRQYNMRVFEVELTVCMTPGRETEAFRRAKRVIADDLRAEYTKQHGGK